MKKQPSPHLDHSTSPTYVLGSGSSILELTPGQCDFLSQAPHVIAMNKFILYWEKVSIAPSHYFLADIHFPSYLVLQRTLEKIESMPREPVLWLERRYRPFLLADVSKAKRQSARAQLAEWQESCPDRSLKLHNLTSRKLLFFRRRDHFSKPRWYNWAVSIHQPLYFWRSSLTILLNLLYLLRPHSPIVLVGVDLNRSESFFQEEFEQDTLLHDHTLGRGYEASLHPTAARLGQNEGIQSRWPFISRMCARHGITIYNSNRESLLVKEGYLEYRNVPELHT